MFHNLAWPTCRLCCKSKAASVRTKGPHLSVSGRRTKFATNAPTMRMWPSLTCLQRRIPRSDLLRLKTCVRNTGPNIVLRLAFDRTTCTEPIQRQRIPVTKDHGLPRPFHQFGGEMPQSPDMDNWTCPLWKVKCQARKEAIRLAKCFKIMLWNTCAYIYIDMFA